MSLNKEDSLSRDQPVSTAATPGPGFVGEVIREGSRLTLRTHDTNRRTEDFLRSFVRELTGRFNRHDLNTPLDIILKELTMNATKANFKKIFFAENGLMLEDPVQYEEGIVRFREIISEEMFAEYALKARDAQLEILMVFDFNDDRFAIEIRNNVPMSSAEERRVRDKLKLAMDHEDPGEFIIEHMDETEGAGLGLMLCIAALRSISVNPRYLSIATDNQSHTVARLVLPLHSNYVPDRMRWEGN